MYRTNRTLRLLTSWACGLALLGAECNVTKDIDGGPAGSPNPVKSASVSPGGSGSSSPGASKPTAGQTGGPFVPPASPRADFLNFGIDTSGGDDPLPKDCPLRPGVRCKIRFRG